MKLGIRPIHSLRCFESTDAKNIARIYGDIAIAYGNIYATGEYKNARNSFCRSVNFFRFTKKMSVLENFWFSCRFLSQQNYIFDQFFLGLLFDFTRWNISARSIHLLLFYCIFCKLYDTMYPVNIRIWEKYTGMNEVQKWSCSLHVIKFCRVLSAFVLSTSLVELYELQGNVQFSL